MNINALMKYRLHQGYMFRPDYKGHNLLHFKIYFFIVQLDAQLF